MLRFEIPNIVFDIFDNDYDEVAVIPSKRCRTNLPDDCPRVGQRCLRSQSEGAAYENLFEKLLDGLTQKDKAHSKKSCCQNTVAVKSESKSNSTVAKSNGFSECFDMHEFEPSDISVKMEGDTLVVRGKHERKSEDGHFEYRQFVRKVTVPDNVLTDQIKCKLDQSGQLQIEAPVKKPEANNQRMIPVEFVQKDKSTKDEQVECAVDSSDSEVTIEDIGTD